MPLIDPITYSNKGSFFVRAFVATLEYMTGRLKLEKMYKTANARYQSNPQKPFFNHALEVMDIDINIVEGSVDNIPKEGSLLIISNHPFGVLDGLVLNHLIHARRQDYKILTNEVLTRAQPMQDWLIAIDDSESAEGTKKNNRVIREIMRLLHTNHCIGIFPAGRLARPHRWGDPCVDWDWKPLVGHLAAKCKPKDGQTMKIVPVFFEGENSKMFQWCARWKWFTMTRSLVIHELMNKYGKKVSLRIGDAFDARDVLEGSAEDITKILREKTLNLGK